MGIYIWWRMKTRLEEEKLTLESSTEKQKKEGKKKSTQETFPRYNRSERLPDSRRLRKGKQRKGLGSRTH